MRTIYIVLTTWLCFAFAGEQLAVSQNQQNMDQMKYRMAKQYESRGNFEQALEIYHVLYQKNPKNTTYFDAISRCSIKLKKYDQLIHFIQACLEKYPNNLHFQVKLGNAYLQKGNEEKAQQIWQRIIRKNKKNISTYRTIANALMSNRMFDRAIQMYIQGRKEIENQALFSLELAQLHTYRLNYERATNEYMRFLQKHPRQLSYVKARLASFKGDFSTYKQVTPEIKRWIEKDPKNIGFHRILVSFLISFENYPEAFSAVKKIEKLKIERNKNGTPGAELYRFGRTLVAEKQYELAQDVFLEILRSYPDYPNQGQVEFELARTFRFQGKLDKSLSSFDKVIEKYPKTGLSLQAYMTRGEIYLHELFYPDSAAKSFELVLETFPKHENRVLALLALGDVEVARNKLERAKSYYDQALKTSIQNARLRKEIKIRGKLKLAELAFYQTNFERSQQHLQSILDGHSQQMDNVYINDAIALNLLIDRDISDYKQALSRYARAMLLEKQHRIQKATELFYAISDSFPNAKLTPKALFKSAALKEKLGDYLSSVMAYRNIVQRYPDNSLCDISLWNIGQIYENQLENIAKAVESYEEILLTYPKSMLARRARKKIRELEQRS